MNLAAGDSAIVSAFADHHVATLMAEAAIIGSVRAHRLRLSFHISTSTHDVDRAVNVLSGHLHP